MENKKFDLFVEKLKEECKVNRTVSLAREEDCVLLETLNLIIDELVEEFKDDRD